MPIRRQARHGGVPSRAATFWIVAAAFVVTMLGTTLPTPLYALYQRDLGFSTLVITVIFAAYAAGVLVALLLLGGGSDVIGRRRMLLLGLACASLSGVAFLLADDLVLLLAARVLSGISAGIFTGTASAALVDLDEDADRATLVATMANMGGLGAGPLLAGLLAQLAPHPLLTPFLVHLALLGAVTTGLCLIQEPSDVVGSPRDLRLARLSVPAPVRGIFARSAIAVFAGFAVVGLFTAVAPLFLRHLLDRPSPAFAGLVVGAVFAASTLAQVFAAQRLGEQAMQVGCAILTIGGIALAVALAAGSLPLLLVAVALAGAGQGISFRSSLALINNASPASRRGEVASSLFVVAYVAVSLPILGEGLVATAVGLRSAGIGFSVAVAVLAAVACGSFASSKRSPLRTATPTHPS